jgi:gliding motility-associated-like protein
LQYKLAFFLSTAFLTLGGSTAFSQQINIVNGNGSPLTLRQCYYNVSHEIKGIYPEGGDLSGCGVFDSAGRKYWNPILASAGVTQFPATCNLTYEADGKTVSKSMMISKPVGFKNPMKDSFTCNGDFFLHAETLYAGDYIYRWSPAQPLEYPDTSNTKGHIEQTTTFVLTALDRQSLQLGIPGGCEGRDTVVIERYPVPDIGISNDTTIFARGQVRLFATGGQNYEWSPRTWLNNPMIYNPIARPQQSTTYTVRVTNEYGCSATKDVTITIIEEIMIPNAFSPNGDGVNDVFRIENFGYQEVVEFRVFNRWGNEVFNTKDGTKGWDGMIDGTPAEPGTYFYSIRLAFRESGIKAFKGDLTLLK